MKELPLLEQPCCVCDGPPLDRADAEGLALRFKALADPARVAILNRVAQAGETCTCLLTEPLGLSQPTVSHHLKKLTEAGLLEREQRGTWAFYSIEPQAASRLSALADLKGGTR